MATTTTPFLGMTLPVPGSNEPYSTTRNNNNLTLIDAKVQSLDGRATLVEGRATVLEAGAGRSTRVVHAPVADLAALAAVSTGTLQSGDLIRVTALNCFFEWSGSAWVQRTQAVVASVAARDSEYAKASSAYLQPGVARAYCEDVDREFIFLTNAYTSRAPVSAWYLTEEQSFGRMANTMNPVPTSETQVVNAFGAFGAHGPGRLEVIFGGLMQCNSALQLNLRLYTQGTAKRDCRFIKGDTNVDAHSLSSYWIQDFTTTGSYAIQIDLVAQASVATASIITDPWWRARFIPAHLIGA